MSVLTYCESVKTQGKGARFSTKILDSKTQYLKGDFWGQGCYRILVSFLWVSNLIGLGTNYRKQTGNEAK